MPRHSGLEVFVQVAFIKDSRCVDVFKSVVVKLLSIPVTVISFLYQAMLWSVPSAVTNVKAAHETDFLINDDHFFMMAPELWNCNIGMSVNLDIFVHAFKVLLDVFWVIIDKKWRFHKTNYVNLNSSFSQPFQNIIKPVLCIIYIGRPFEHEIRRNHPSSNAYLFLGFHQFVVKIFVISASIAVEFSITRFSLLSVAVKPVLSH